MASRGSSGMARELSRALSTTTPPPSGMAIVPDSPVDELAYELEMAQSLGKPRDKKQKKTYVFQSMDIRFRSVVLQVRLFVNWFSAAATVIARKIALKYDAKVATITTLVLCCIVIPLLLRRGPSLSYEMALHDSLGFFDDIPQDLWMLRKNITIDHVHTSSQLDGSYPRPFLQANWEPDFACMHEKRMGYGGLTVLNHWLCDPHRIKDKDCLVYSTGFDEAFELAIHASLPHCEINVFDPSNPSKAGRWHKWRLRGEEEAPSDDSKTLVETMTELGHLEKKVDIFKIDCDGCEWKLYKDIVKYDFRQILMEVHAQSGPIPDKELFSTLHDAGYVIFHKEATLVGCQGRCVQFSFLKLSKDFFRLQRREK